MVAMAVRDHGAIDRPPRIQIEVAWRAIEPFGSRDDEFHNLARMGLPIRRFKSSVAVGNDRSSGSANGIGTAEQADGARVGQRLRRTADHADRCSGAPSVTMRSRSAYSVGSLATGSARSDSAGLNE